MKHLIISGAVLLVSIFNAHLSAAEETSYQSCLNTTATHVRNCRTYFSRDLVSGSSTHTPGDELSQWKLRKDGSCVAEDHQFQENGKRYVYVNDTVTGDVRYHFERSLRRVSESNKVLIEDYWRNTFFTTGVVKNSGYFVAECELAQ